MSPKLSRADLAAMATTGRELLRAVGGPQQLAWRSFARLKMAGTVAKLPRYRSLVRQRFAGARRWSIAVNNNRKNSISV